MLGGKPARLCRFPKKELVKIDGLRIMRIYSKIRNFFHKKENEVDVQPSVNAIIKSLEKKGMKPEQIVQGAQFMIAEGTRKSRNRESFVEKAKEMTLSNDETQSNEGMKKPDDDWLNRLYGIVEDISDENMQTLWARILAGEIKKPNSYSYRTLEVLRNIAPDEAKRFVECTKYLCFRDQMLCADDYGLSLQDQLVLTDAGLISAESLTNTVTVPAGEKVTFGLSRNHVIVVQNDSNEEKKIDYSIKQLTKVGLEILNLINEDNYLETADYIAKKLKEKGLSSIRLHKVTEWKSETQVSYYSIPEKNY